LSASSLGTALDFAVILSLINRQDYILKSLSAINKNFARCAKYSLCLTRVVSIKEAKYQNEWFEKVISNPNDDTFSLLPGVAVKNIVIQPHPSSGSDCICVAVLDDQYSVVKGAVTPQSTPQSPYIMTTRSRALKETSKKAADVKSTVVGDRNILFVSVACALYSGMVPAAKHLDQMRKVQIKNQFSHSEIVAGRAFEALARDNAEKFDCLPILVEIAKYDEQPDVSEEYILISETNAQVLFTSATVSMLVDRKTC
jgi:hypothetical protein